MSNSKSKAKAKPTLVMSAVATPTLVAHGVELGYTAVKAHFKSIEMPGPNVYVFVADANAKWVDPDGGMRTPPFDETIIYTTKFGQPDAICNRIARAKCREAIRNGMNTLAMQGEPIRFQPEDTKYAGGICRNGLGVGVSGESYAVDIFTAEMIATATHGLVLVEFHDARLMDKEFRFF